MYLTFNFLYNIKLKQKSLLASIPYIDPRFYELEEIKRQKQRWISNKNFDSTVGKIILPHIQSFNTSPAEPHKFRVLDRKKWVFPDKDFLV